MCHHCSPVVEARRYIGLQKDKAVKIALSHGFYTVKFVYHYDMIALQNRNDRLVLWVIKDHVVKAAIG